MAGTVCFTIPTAQMSHYASIANTASNYSYLLEVVLRVEDSPEAEAVVASAPSRKNLSQHPEGML